MHKKEADICGQWTWTLGWALFSKYILLISYFEDLILLILMVCFFLHITYRNLVEFSLL